MRVHDLQNQGLGISVDGGKMNNPHRPALPDCFAMPLFGNRETVCNNQRRLKKKKRERKKKKKPTSALLKRNDEPKHGTLILLFHEATPSKMAR